MLRRIHWPDFALGLFLVAFSGLILFAIRKLAMGSPDDMGPGWVPRAIGIALMAAGVYQCLRGLSAGEMAFPRFIWRPLLAVLASGAVFAIALPTVGLLIAVMACMAIANLASPPFRAREIALASAGVAAFCALLFVRALGLPLKIWPW